MGDTISEEREDQSTETVGERPRATKSRPKLEKVPKELQGRYEIRDEIGHGGMGAVYRARDKQLGRDVAIKLVRARKELNEMLTARLLREAQALAQLSHPNVVAVYDVIEAEGSVCLVMELVSGKAGDEWVREKQQPWREVLRVFRDAGRGLAAAHAVGLVHRDFKPANLMLGDDGRVRVLDFGLARTASVASSSGSFPSLEMSPDNDDPTTIRDKEDTGGPTEKLGPGEHEGTAPPAVHSLHSSGQRQASLLESPLTQAGVIVGTPPYMAPEQHRGSASDARSDQFSYCVSFYRALYGQRPFGGDTYGEVKQNIVAGNLRQPPAGSDVPGWLRDIVLRGLATEPHRRWPSMDALLEALGHDPDARRRRIFVGAGAGVLLAGTAITAWIAIHGRGPSCATDGQEFAGVWDAAQRKAVTDAFGKSKKPFAAAALNATTKALDSYIDKWRAMRLDACKATNERGTQSSALLDLRMACMQRRVDDVRAVVGVLATADDDVIEHATNLTSALPGLDACADIDALEAPVPLPTDAKVRKRVEAVQRTLATVKSMTDAGRYAAARTALAPVVAEAKDIAWRPLEGETLLAEARLAESTGDYPLAEKQYREASAAAESGRDDVTAALARNGLVWVVGERLGRYKEATDIATDAAAKVERLGGHALIQADLEQKMSALFFEQDNLDEAEKRSKHVLEIREKELGPEDWTIASSLGDLGDIAVQRAEYDAAIEDYRRALKIAEKTLGPTHSLCGTLRANLGAALVAKGQPSDALAELQRARDITERSLGPEHAQLASIDVNIGNTLVALGRADEAAERYKRAAAIWTKALGPDHPNVGTAMFHLGEVALSQGRAADATSAFQQALDIWKAKLGAEHPSLASAYIGLGDAAFAQHHAAVALTNYEKALELLQKAYGIGHIMTVDAITAIGKSQIALGKTVVGKNTLERALKLAETQPDPMLTASVRFNVAQALASVDKQRAHDLAVAAYDAFATGGADHAKDASDADQWLRAHK